MQTRDLYMNVYGRYKLGYRLVLSSTSSDRPKLVRAV